MNEHSNIVKGEIMQSQQWVKGKGVCASKAALSISRTVEQNVGKGYAPPMDFIGPKQ
jgi:hypothetical protein